MSTVGTCSLPEQASQMTLAQKLNGPWHKRALQVYMAIVLAHWAEHLVQAAQIYVLGWAVPDSRGLLGQWFPWLVSSETLHYGYAIVMLIGLWVLRSGFAGRSYFWWMVAFWIQFWHHLEHALLQGQAIAGHNLFNSPVPVSIVQLWIPRVELHLLYNTLVFIPMVVAMFEHIFPTAAEEKRHACSCAWHPQPAAA
jgi:hypothetical protein